MMRPFPLLAAFLLIPLAIQAADQARFRFPRSAPEAQGVSSAALLEFLEAAETRINSLHSFMLIRHGQVVTEGWWAPYAAGEPHQMFSLSKSFTSTAVGLAVADGKLSVDDLVLKYFPDESPAQPSANLRAMRVRDLLTMSVGHHNEDIQGFPYNSDESVVKKFLALPVAHKPGTFFVYNTPASYMLSAIVQKVTGQSVLDYLRPRLFEPLGIENPTWEASKQGVSMGGFGLNIRTEDIARFGQLYLQRGKWQGKQIVPEAWVDSATSRWMSNGSSPASDWEQGYGFQFWRCRHGVFRGDGAHGQFCVVLPQYDAVVAITAGTRDLQGVLNVLWDKLLPVFQSAALPPSTEAQKALQEKLAGLSLRQPIAIETPPVAAAIAGKRWVFPENPGRVEEITLQPAGSGSKSTEILFRVAGREQRLIVTPGEWRKGELVIESAVEPVSASGAWTASDTFTLDVVRYRTPFTSQQRLRFDGDKVTLETQANVGPASARPTSVVGRRD